MFVTIIFFINIYSLQAQDIDGFSKLLKNITLNYPKAFQQSHLSSVQWSTPTKQTYWQIAWNTAISSSNPLRLLFSTEGAGDVFAEETLGLSTYLAFRTKQWESPFDIGISLQPIYIDQNIYYFSFTGDIKYTLLAESGKYHPQIDVGLIYAYSHLFFAYELALGDTSFTGIDKADSDVRIKINDLRLEAQSVIYSISGRVHLSKKFEYIGTALGFEPSLLISVFNTDTIGDVEISRDAGASFERLTKFNEITTDFLKTKYFLYNDMQIEPLFNFYASTNIPIHPIISTNIKLGIQALTWIGNISFGINVSW